MMLIWCISLVLAKNKIKNACGEAVTNPQTETSPTFANNQDPRD